MCLQIFTYGLQGCFNSSLFEEGGYMWLTYNYLQYKFIKLIVFFVVTNSNICFRMLY